MKICLAIIYNHNFERNVPVLNRIYAGRFSNVYHIMPFYRGSDPHVIGVYESSYQFSGYITQASEVLMRENADYYVFVADDMVINPRLNENNILSEIGLSKAPAGFIDDIRVLDDEHFARWGWGWESVVNLISKSNACEGLSHLPSLDDARAAFERNGLDWRVGVSAKLANFIYKLHYKPQRRPLIGIALKMRRFLRSDDKCYPLATGYSDLVVVPTGSFRDFCHYCGVFAAQRVFVENAIPTALVFSCSKIVTSKDAGFKSERGVDNYAVRGRFEKLHKFSYTSLVENFPSDYLFIHPVKLSKWRDLP